MAAMAPSIMAPRCRLLKIQPAHEQQQQQQQLRPTAVAQIQCMKNGNAVLHESQQLQKPTGMKMRMRSSSSRKNGNSRRFRLTVKAVEEVAGPASDSVVSEVAVLEEAPGTPGVTGPGSEKQRKPGVLDRGETLSGYAPTSKADSGPSSQSANGGAFSDARWVKGTWDLTAFTKDAKVDWDSVIDAEVKRRKWLEDNPETSSNEEPVVFDTSIIPWWAWVKRFHLPEAELLNGRAAMVGYFAAYLVDSLTGVGLVDQQSSFLGKLLIFITVLGVLLIRKTEDLETLKTLAKESTFYDKQWQASWKEDNKPSE